MKPIILTSFLIFLVSFNAGAADINCHTPRHDKEFTLSADKVVFHQLSGREVASEIKAITRFEGSGLTKILEHKGLRYTLHVDNLKTYSEDKDYVLIRSQEGHEIIYPLICKS